MTRPVGVGEWHPVQPPPDPVTGKQRRPRARFASDLKRPANWLTPAEAGDYLGVKESFIRYHMNKVRDLPYIRRRWSYIPCRVSCYLTVEDLNRWMLSTGLTATQKRFKRLLYVPPRQPPQNCVIFSRSELIDMNPLRQWRKATNLRAIDVANKLSVSERTILAYETGAFRPSDESFTELSRLMLLAPDELKAKWNSWVTQLRVGGPASARLPKVTLTEEARSGEKV